MDGKISLCVNTEISFVMDKMNIFYGLNATGKTTLTRLLKANSYLHFELLPADSDDNKFVDCAVASDAEYIVTNDKHFNPLKAIPWPKVEIIKIADFIKQL